jgi:hypothetical protein
MKARQFPKARQDCFSREFGSELLVYDPQRDVAHCLNLTSAAAWTLCDGNNSPSQIASTLSRQLSVRVDEQVVMLALAQLRETHLLLEPEVSIQRPSRRVALRKIGTVAAVIVAPTPAQAVTCLHNNAPCANNAMCCSGICVPLLGRCLGG